MIDERDGPREEPEVEEAFVRALEKATRELYNPPPETPREEMWHEIRASRDAEDVRPIESAGSLRRRIRPRPWWIGIAAALAIGIALGRLSDEAGAPRSDGPAVADGAAALSDPGRGEVSDVELLPYRVETDRLIDRSETFLTMVRAGEAGAESVDDVRAWARPLLTRTRLLLGTPVAADPELRGLLDDLEIVLVQISQLPATDSEEREWIEEGLDDSRLLFRLRAASAAGASNTVRM